MERGAIILDVRTPNEFKSGHVKGSQNIPLNKLKGQLTQLQKKGKPVITCCASGMRSGSAASQLKSAGVEAMNGGGWHSVNSVVS